MSQTPSQSKYRTCTKTQNRSDHHMNKSSTIRVLHNVINGPTISVRMDGKPLIAQLSYKEITAYISVKSDDHILTIWAGETLLIEEELMINRNSHLTLVVAGTVASNPPVLSLLNYEDNLKCPRPGYFHVRFLHVAYGVPAVDIYVGKTRIFKNVSYSNSGDPEYLPIRLGRLNDPNNPEYYNVSVKLAGTNTVVVGPIPIYFINGGIYTIFATGAVGDRLSAILSHDNPDYCETLECNFDTEAYMGKWYQIASIPQFFSGDCIKSTAEYTLLQDKVNVYNTCYQIGGKTTDIIGEVSAPNPCIPAALRVEFPDPPAPIPPFPKSPPGPNYLIHATNYCEYAVVGSPSRSSFFILSRKKTMCSSKYYNILTYAKSLGYDVDLIIPDKGAIADC